MDLRTIDGYLDAVPRSVVRTESIGPFTLFVNEGHGWRYYARPSPGADVFTDEDVATVRARQRALTQPEAIEWIVDLAPSVGTAASAAGMEIVTHPLMVLRRGALTHVVAPDQVDIAIVSPDADLAALHAVAHVAFGAPGTAVRPDDAPAIEAAVVGSDPEIIAFTRNRIRDGFTVMAGAWLDGRAVASGSYQPVDGVAEITGIATLPAFRRRGIGAALTAALATHALLHGVGDLFLSADDADVARVYGRLGFVEVGTVGGASPVAG